MIARFYEKTSRSIVKAITFRLVIIITNGIIVLIVTKNYTATAGVIVLSSITSTLLYLIHERLWNHIHWGKHKAK